MNAQLKQVQQWLDANAGWARGLAAPLLVMTVLSMMVLPLPPWLLDTFFSLNIALALVVMMVSAYMRRPLDFSV
ncbi:MAG TPA: FHIPEP family type III secretion protein, partial [Hydrogenophaga sp.]